LVGVKYRIVDDQFLALVPQCTGVGECIQVHSFCPFVGAGVDYILIEFITGTSPHFFRELVWCEPNQVQSVVLQWNDASSTPIE